MNYLKLFSKTKTVKTENINKNEFMKPNGEEKPALQNYVNYVYY